MLRATSSRPSPRARARALLNFGWTALRLVVGIAIVALSLLPAARESQLLLWRLLLGVDAGDYTIAGQKPGCVIMQVPHFEWRPQFQARLAAEASNSPDAYVLARATSAKNVELPPLAAWREHSLLVWAALYEANDSFDATPERRRRAAELLEAAQQATPENGALWLAEGLMHAHAGRVEEMFAALRSATDKSGWDDLEPVARAHAIRLLAASGVPPIEADEAIWWNGLDSNPSTWLALKLGAILSDAVSRDDHPRVAGVAALVTKLVGQRWARGRDRRPIGAFTDSGVEAAAARLVEPNPPPTAGPFPSQAHRLEPVRRYLRHLDLPASVDPISAELEATARWEATRYSSADQELSGFFLRRLAGIALLSLMGLLLACLLTSLPFLLLDRATPGLPRSLPFWSAAVLASALAAASLFRMVDCFDQPVGFRSGPVSHVLGRIADPLVVVVLAAVALMGLKILSWREGTRIVALSPDVVIVAACYVAATFWLTGLRAGRLAALF